MGTHKGCVTITSRNTALDAAQASRIGIPAGRYVDLSVSDTGNGMDAATLLRIFEPFFTTRQVGHGTGLGLSVIHGIMQTHQGGIDVQSTPGQGSVFHLYFPACEDAVVTSSEPAPAPATVHGGGRHVMYVDDDQALVFLVQRVLRRKGFTVTTFTDPLLAQAALAERAQEFDLLVTDYNMPGYSGLDLLRIVKAIRPDLPLALASGYVTAELEKDAFAAGASTLVYKPNDVNELCETVQQLILGGNAS